MDPYQILEILQGILIGGSIGGAMFIATVVLGLMKH